MISPADRPLPSAAPASTKQSSRLTWAERRQRFFYQLFQVPARLLATLFTRRHVVGREHLPRTGGFLLASNHISHFDPVLVGLAVRRTVDWMATREFFQGPLGVFFRLIGTFPVDRAGRDPRAVREAARRLRRGRRLGMFPEGGIRAGATSVLGGAPLRVGVERLATLSRIPVVPCVILGADRLYDFRRSWRPWRRVPVWVGFGPAISPEELAASPDALGQRLRALSAELQAAFHLQPADLPTTPQQRKGGDRS